MLNAQALIGTSERRVSINDPGFQDRIQTFYDPRIQGKCQGKGMGRAMSWDGHIACWNLNIDNNDYASCNAISGCAWKNATLWFNLTVYAPKCENYVNKTHYAIITNESSEYCSTSSGLANERLCNTFKCDWINQSELAQMTFSQTNSATSIWQTVGYVVTFRADIGLLGYSWIFSFIFFWIPFIMFIWSIYMALPVIH